MGPGNMGAPIGGVIIVFLIAGCVIQIMLFAAALFSMILLRHHERARQLIPVASIGMILCVPIAIASVALLHFMTGKKSGGILDIGFVTIWMLVAALTCWIVSLFVVKFTLSVWIYLANWTSSVKS